MEIYVGKKPLTSDKWFKFPAFQGADSHVAHAMMDFKEDGFDQRWWDWLRYKARWERERLQKVNTSV